MAEIPRRLRALVYELIDAETALRSAGRSIAADSVAFVAKRSNSLAPDEFLDESRRVLEEALLGERDLAPEIIASILDIMAMIDEMLQESSR